MTISSLWKALDSGGSGKPVGASDFVASIQATRANPVGPPTLAVDLSIWICESMTSFGVNEQHANAPLYLVFTRTMKLLMLGVRLVFVAEGKQRTDMGTRKRRSGTPFWKATRDCQEMLQSLGVPVVQAKCEGEALCALLNQRGLVDGVISNDGDCLPFGAKVLYTKYSNENLDQGRVMQYTCESLYAVVDASADEDICSDEMGTLTLRRNDLITFAILTGSDVAGGGLPKVGHRKAVRFIRKCHIDHPLSRDQASLDELRSWARVGSVQDVQHTGIQRAKGNCCSRCGHLGTKRCHAKHGCETCGTTEGELCYLITTEDRFRKSLRTKALTLGYPFDPSRIIEIYMHPNENQIPLQFVNGLPNGFVPRLYDLLKLRLIVKGRSLEGSRSFVRQSVLRALSRMELHRSQEETRLHQQTGIERENPVPTKIRKTLTQNQRPCYEIGWVVKATVTDENGEGLDGYEYITIEEQELVDQKYPGLVTEFKNVEKEKVKQGDEMQRQRQLFLEKFLSSHPGAEDHQNNEKQRNTRSTKKRSEYFRAEDAHPPNGYRRRKGEKKLRGDDAGNLLRFANNRSLQFSPAKTRAHEANMKTMYSPCTVVDNPDHLRTPLGDRTYCQMGAFEIEITPIETSFGVFPPRNIYVHNFE